MSNAGGLLSGLSRRDQVSSQRFAVRLGALVACAASLAACGSISEKMSTTMGDNSLVGLPANAPARPEAPPTFPAVHDMPAARSNAVLTGTEQVRMEEDMVAAREQLDGTAAQKAAQKAAVVQKAADDQKAVKARTKKDTATAIPAASRSIY